MPASLILFMKECGLPVRRPKRISVCVFCKMSLLKSKIKTLIYLRVNLNKGLKSRNCIAKAAPATVQKHLSKIGKFQILQLEKCSICFFF